MFLLYTFLKNGPLVMMNQTFMLLVGFLLGCFFE